MISKEISWYKGEVKVTLVQQEGDTQKLPSWRTHSCLRRKLPYLHISIWSFLIHNEDTHFTQTIIQSHSPWVPKGREARAWNWGRPVKRMAQGRWLPLVGHRPRTSQELELLPETKQGRSIPDALPCKFSSFDLGIVLWHFSAFTLTLFVYWLAISRSPGLITWTDGSFWLNQSPYFYHLENLAGAETLQVLGPLLEFSRQCSHWSWWGNMARNPRDTHTHIWEQALPACGPPPARLALTSDNCYQVLHAKGKELIRAAEVSHILQDTSKTKCWHPWCANRCMSHFSQSNTGCSICPFLAFNLDSRMINSCDETCFNKCIINAVQNTASRSSQTQRSWSRCLLPLSISVTLPQPVPSPGGEAGAQAVLAKDASPLPRGEGFCFHLHPSREPS